MQMHRFSHLVLALLPSLVVAQEAGTINGKWSATFQGTGGGNREAELTITDSGGIWRTFARGNQAKNNKCLGKEFPVDFQTRSAAELVFEVKASTVMQGCTDMSVNAKSTDGRTFDGVIREGSPIKLVRQ